MSGIHEAHGFQMERPEGKEVEAQRKEGERLKGQGQPELWITPARLANPAGSLICSASLPFDSVPGLEECSGVHALLSCSSDCEEGSHREVVFPGGGD